MARTFSCPGLPPFAAHAFWSFPLWRVFSSWSQTTVHEDGLAVQRMPCITSRAHAGAQSNAVDETAAAIDSPRGERRRSGGALCRLPDLEPACKSIPCSHPAYSGVTAVAVTSLRKHSHKARKLLPPGGREGFPISAHARVGLGAVPCCSAKGWGAWHLAHVVLVEHIYVNRLVFRMDNKELPLVLPHCMRGQTSGRRKPTAWAASLTGQAGPHRSRATSPPRCCR